MASAVSSSSSSSAPMPADGSWDATLALLRWRQTRRGYDGDDALLRTAFELLESDSDSDGASSRLRAAAARCNVPADRIATELIHLALLLITKPRRDEPGAHSRAVLKLLHLGLKALRATGDGASLAIPMNACNLLLAAMADTLESAAASDEDAVVDVLQIFVFLFALSSAAEDAPLGSPSFNMYKPPTNVFSAFMQRACTAVFARLDSAAGPHQARLVKLVLAIMRVFQDLQSSQMNKKKVFVAIAKTSFREIAGYRHALLKHKQTVEGVTEILDVLDRIIVDALFDSEHLRDYDGALVHIRMWQDETGTTEDAHDDGAKQKHKKQRRKQNGNEASSSSSLVSYQRHLFDELKAFLSDASVASDAKESIGSLLEVLVRGFSARIRAAANDKIEDTRSDLKSSKKRVANVIATTSTAYSPFKFWAELCGVAFGAFQAVEQHRDGQEDAVAMLICVYESLFRALCEADVYRVTEDTEEQEQFAMMQIILSRFVELLRAEGLATRASLETAMRRVCSVVSNAVRCTPNLVNSSLVSIFEVLGACSAVADASSASMVDMLHAYESMRLVDAFLRSCCSTEDDNAAVASGLLSIFSHSATEATLRRTYMTLPPGQLEIVWRLLTDKLAVLCGARKPDTVAAKMALVRSLLAVFLQEIHITPQNRAKVGELVKDSHEKLLATLSSRVARFQSTPKKAKKETFSVVERELFSVVGELLALYDGLAPTVRTETLDVVLAALETKLAPVMTSLLAGDDDQIVGAAAGIVKIGVHKLRRVSSSDSSERVASLIVDRVVQWRCWDAVAFYLPELVSDIGDEKATALYVELLESYLGPDCAASERILRDAAFYEITALQRVASSVFTAVVSRKDFVRDLATVRRFFGYLLTIPSGYLDVTSAASGELLVAVLHVHKEVAQAKHSDPTTTHASVALWIEKYLVAIASHGSTDVRASVSSWTEFLLLEAETFADSSARLVKVAVAHLTTLSRETHATQIRALDNALTKLLKQKTSRGYETSATVLAAAASIPEATASTSATTFVDALLASVASSPSIVASLDNDTSFQLLTALVRYAASLPESVSAPSSVQARRQKIVSLLETHLTSALAAAMETILGAKSSTGSRHAFFATFCETFHLLRPTVTLETFGDLLAVALVLAAESEEGHDDQQIETDRPLAWLVQHANKDEFRLLVATLERELLVPSAERRVAALKALARVLETDKKLSNARRQVLSESKTSFLALFGQIFAHALTVTSPSAASLCVWNLRVFVLFYCKAELFSWKPHELLQVFTGFQPLTVLAAQATHESFTTTTSWTPRQIHQVWLLSYNLLLRVVRHHFASLVNGIPHMVDALNALLRVLVACSSQPAWAPYTLEWGSNLARLYGYLKPQDAALRKHVVYLLLTYLRGVTQGRLSLALQHKLRPGVFALLEMCSLFEKEQLYASLDSTGKSLLKSLDTSYKLTYRYAGKV